MHYQKKQITWLKSGQNIYIAIFFFPKKSYICQEAHEKMLSIINRQENANQNHNEISRPMYQNGYHQKEHK